MSKEDITGLEWHIINIVLQYVRQNDDMMRTRYPELKGIIKKIDEIV